MRHELYQGVYATVKKFVTQKDFYIRFLLPADFFVYTQKVDNPVLRCTFTNLRYNKENGAFYIEDIVAELMPKQIYSIIRNYVFEEIAKEQKQIFNGSFDTPKSKLEEDYNVELSNEDKEYYCEIIDMFKFFLWDEIIDAKDISKKGSIHRLAFGFSETEVPIHFLSELLDVLHKYDGIFLSGVIENFMLDDFKFYSHEKKLEYILKLEKEGYVVTKKISNGTIIKIALTLKFYEAFKKSFYYDYDPKVIRPCGCFFN